MPPTERSGERAREGRTTLVFLVAVLLHGLAYLFVASPWMGEDEPWHFEYASQVASGHAPWGGRPVVYGPDAAVDERRLFAPSVLQFRRRFGSLSYEAIEARQREILAAMRSDDFFRKVDWAGAVDQRRDFDSIEPFFTGALQSPLYYVLLGGWLAVAPTRTIDGQLFAARCLSLALYVLTAWLGLLFARRVFADSLLALCAAVCIAWLPMHARQAALVNNDVLARTLSAALLLIAARVVSREAGRLELAGAAGVSALALLTKSTTGGAIVVLVATLLVVRAARSAADARAKRWPRIVAVVAVAAVVFAGAIALWYSQHSPVLPKSLAALRLRVAAGLSRETLGEMGRTFVGSFNWYSRDFPSAAYAVAGLVLACVVAGVLVVAARARDGISRAQVALCCGAIAAQLALVVLRGVGHGRYLMPAVPAFGALCVVGLVGPWPQRWRPRAAAILCAALIAYDALFLWGGLVPNEYLVWGS